MKMRKNVYICRELGCGAPSISQSPADAVTPMFASCRRPGCNGMATSTMFRHPQDMLADAHFEFTYEGAAPGYGPTGSKHLRPAKYPEVWPFKGRGAGEDN